MEYLIYYLIVMNVIGFFIMGIDKRKARHHKWRISEASLLLIALIGGAIGAGFGMLLFHHKTKHLKFLLGVPVLILFNVFAVWYLFYK